METPTILAGFTRHVRVAQADLFPKKEEIRKNGL